MNHGGQRDGAGRPASDQPNSKQVRVDEKTHKKLKSIAQKEKRTISAVIKNLIDSIKER